MQKDALSPVLLPITFGYNQFTTAKRNRQEDKLDTSFCRGGLVTKCNLQ